MLAPPEGCPLPCGPFPCAPLPCAPLPCDPVACVSLGVASVRRGSPLMPTPCFVGVLLQLVELLAKHNKLCVDCELCVVSVCDTPNTPRRALVCTGIPGIKGNPGIAGGMRIESCFCASQLPLLLPLCPQLLPLGRTVGDSLPELELLDIVITVSVLLRVFAGVPCEACPLSGSVLWPTLPLPPLPLPAVLPLPPLEVLSFFSFRRFASGALCTSCRRKPSLCAR